MKAARRTRVVCYLLCFLLGGALGAQTVARSVVVVPTLGNDHQFNLDYSVAHLAALLDAIGPSGIIVDDATSWLARDCPLNPAQPEIQVALRFSREHGIPLIGFRQWPPPGVADPYAASERAREAESAALRDTATAHASWRVQLDRRTALIAREYSFAPRSGALEQLLATGFAEREAELSPAQRTANVTRAAALADSITRYVSQAGGPGTWAIVINWMTARPLEEALHERGGIRVVPVGSYVPLSAESIERRLDRTHLSWVLASNLDEFYGMWAPQVFHGERLAGLLRRLEQKAPEDPVTSYLRARWLMQHRDYAAAEPILRRLADLPPHVTFPFPVNGKWLRPPWSSVRRKAQLNLAFVLDYRGQRQDALALYRELLAFGDQLDAEARYFGYLYDDIQAAVRSYLEQPYTGGPQEAFRHLRGTVRRPECEPR